jgi:hypothetical protein
MDFIHMKPMNGVVKGGSASAPLAGTPARSGVTVRVLGQEGKTYALYVRGGTHIELQLKLPQGKYRGEWINTKTGKVDRSDDVQGANDARFASPDYIDDIVLRVKTIE